MGEQIDWKAVAENYDCMRDTSPMHVYDETGSFCGIALERLTRGVHYKSADESKLLPIDTCQQCLGALRYMRERDSAVSSARGEGG